jgi:hypothetical protein
MGDGDAQYEATLPLDGWLTVEVGGDSITCVSVDEGETITVRLHRENPRDD